MIKVYVMKSCPDCASVKEQAAGDPRFDLIDIGEHVRNLKQFMALRDASPAFDSIRRSGSIGIPCFVFEDGTVSFAPEDAGLAAGAEGAVCSIDGKGC